jgi:hypothetical protein
MYASIGRHRFLLQGLLLRMVQGWLLLRALSGPDVAGGWSEPIVPVHAHVR